jgi:hypothetical protein
MTDEQLEQGIEAITAMLAARDAGTNAKAIEGVAEPAPERKTKRKRPNEIVDAATPRSGRGSASDLTVWRLGRAVTRGELWVTRSRRRDAAL